MYTCNREVTDTKSSAHEDRAFCLPTQRAALAARMRRVARGRRLRRQLGGACMHRRGGLLARGELGLELVQGVEGLKWSEGVEVESLNALHQLVLLSHFRFDRSGTGLLFTHLGL